MAVSRNNAVSRLAARHMVDDDTLVLAPGEGTRFGDPTVDAPIRVTVAARSTLVNGQIAPTSTQTIFDVATRTDDTLSGLTVAEGTADQNFGRNDPVASLITWGVIQDLASSGGNPDAVLTTEEYEDPEWLRTLAPEKVVGLPDALDAKADDASVVKLEGDQDVMGTKTFTAPMVRSGPALGSGGDRDVIKADEVSIITTNFQGARYHRIDQSHFYNNYPGGVFGDNATITIEQTTQGNLSGQVAFSVLAGTNGVYRLITFFRDNGSIATGAYVDISNSRHANGDIRGIAVSNDDPLYFEPHMFSIWPDVNGSAFKIAGNTSGDNIGYCLSLYDLSDPDPHFPSGAYSSADGKKKWTIGPKGEMYWGTNLGITPASTYVTKQSLDTADSTLRIDGKSKVVKADNGSENFFTLLSSDGSVGLGMNYAGLQVAGSNAVSDLSLDSKGNGSYVWLGKDIFTGLRVGADDAGNTIWNGGRDISITANSGHKVSIGQVSASTTTGLTVETTTGRTILTTPNFAPSDSLLSDAQISMYLDQTANKLKFRVRYSDGTTLKTGEIPLT